MRRGSQSKSRRSELRYTNQYLATAFSASDFFNACIVFNILFTRQEKNATLVDSLEVLDFIIWICSVPFALVDCSHVAYVVPGASMRSSTFFRGRQIARTSSWSIANPWRQHQRPSRLVPKITVVKNNEKALHVPWNLAKPDERAECENNKDHEEVNLSQSSVRRKRVNKPGLHARCSPVASNP